VTHVLEINELDFETEVLEADLPFLLDFTATWCGPCKALAPVLEALATETQGALKVGKVDLDSAPALATRYGIRGAPTLLVFRGGREVQRQVGAGTKSSLQKLVEKSAGWRPPPAAHSGDRRFVAQRAQLVGCEAPRREQLVRVSAR